VALGRAYAEVLEKSFGLDRLLDIDLCDEDADDSSGTLQEYLQAAVCWCNLSARFDENEDLSLFPLPFPTCYKGLFVEVVMEVAKRSTLVVQEPLPKGSVSFYGQEFVLRKTAEYEVCKVVEACV
jgi:hypothetical protein